MVERKGQSLLYPLQASILRFRRPEDNLIEPLRSIPILTKNTIPRTFCNLLQIVASYIAKKNYLTLGLWVCIIDITDRPVLLWLLPSLYTELCLHPTHTRTTARIG